MIEHKLDIIGYLNNLLHKAISEHYSIDLNKNIVTFSQRADLGQFQCNIAFQMVKSFKGSKKLPEIAGDLLKIIETIDNLENVNEVSGFINFSLSNAFLTEFANDMLSKEIYDIASTGQEKVMIDFGGPNIAKSMHVGHLRSSIIGNSLQKIYRFFGHEVVSDIHLGDWGLPIGMIIMKLEEDYPQFKNDNFSEEDLSLITISYLERIYPIAAAFCKEDLTARQTAQKITSALQQKDKKYYRIWQQIVKVSVASLKANYDKLGIEFDLWCGESDTQPFIDDVVTDLSEKGHIYKSDGAIIADTSFNAPLILITSEGSLTYGITDVATIYDRIFNKEAEKIIYVVDQRQSLHFKQVFELSTKSFDSARFTLEHVGFGTLNGKDGKPFKTRKGGVMKLEDLLSLTESKVLEKMQDKQDKAEYQSIVPIIAGAAIKFADLSRYRLTDYVFDIDQFTEFNGKTGPYLIYNAVRIKSLLKKAADLGYKPTNIKNIIEIEEVKNLINQLIKCYSYIHKSYTENAPHHLCEYLYNVSHAFSSFYYSVNILNHPNKEKKEELLGLCIIILNNLEICLKLLGIEIDLVEYM